MGENSKIEWVSRYLEDGTFIPGHTFNPWIGCTKCSPGCTNCYAAANPYWQHTWGPQSTRHVTADYYWQGPIKWNAAAKASGHRQNVFCGSMCDVFEDLPELVEARDRLFQLIDQTPHLNWLLLTKRPENIERLWPFGWYDELFTWPNIWVGTSVENQATADERIPTLLEIPAKVRFLSCEPLLEEIDIEAHLIPHFAADDPRHDPRRDGIEWIIAGGEFGPKARPMHPQWARSLRDQAKYYGKDFYFKQWGEWLANNQVWGDIEIQGALHYWEPGKTKFHSRRVGKKDAGRLLDGVEHSEFPAAVAVL